MVLHGAPSTMFRMVPLPRKRERIQGVPAVPLRILPCVAGEGDHAKHGGGGVPRAAGEQR